MNRGFAEPWILVLLLPIAFVAMAMLLGRGQRGERWRRLGDPRILGRLLPGRAAIWPLIAAIAGLALATIGTAGPRWGKPEPTAVRTGRDVIIVLDVSRSMNAEQPSRLEQAKRALHLLADRWANGGDHRVGMVVVAAKARLAFPLTADMGHLRFVLEQIEPDALPWKVAGDSADEFVSGTRLGIGLQLATDSLDAQRRGAQDVVLLSDGDDPAGDQEWLRGVNAAKAAGVPVHVVALGDSAEGHPIPYQGKLLQWRGEIVKSRRNDEVLHDIARLTGGTLFPGTPGGVSLGRLLEDVWSGKPAPPDAMSTQTLAPVHREWFLVPAVILLALWARYRRNITPRAEMDVRTTRRSPFRPIAAALVLFGVAATAADPALALLRQAQNHFDGVDYEGALALFERAEGIALDPGGAAYNEAVCLYKLARFAECAERCLRAVDDTASTPDRRALAWFLRGNALTASSPKRKPLEDAMAAYRECLRLGCEADLLRDARHNLNLAAALWSQAPAESEPAPPDLPPNVSSKEKADPKTPLDMKKTEQKGDASTGSKSGEKPSPSENPNGKRVPGSLTVIPEQDHLAPLSIEETDAHLERMIHRIAGERRASQMSASRIHPNARDW